LKLDVGGDESDFDSIRRHNAPLAVGKDRLFQVITKLWLKV